MTTPEPAPEQPNGSPTGNPDLPPPSHEPAPIKAAHIASQTASTSPAKPNQARKPISERVRSKALTLLNSGLSQRQTAVLTGASQTTVHRIGRQTDLDPEPLSITPGQGFGQSVIRSLESLAQRQLSYYDQALSAGAVNPSTIPLGFAILMTKRSEFMSESAALVPAGANTTPDQFLQTLLSDPTESIIDLQPGSAPAQSAQPVPA